MHQVGVPSGAFPCSPLYQGEEGPAVAAAAKVAQVDLKSKLTDKGQTLVS